MVLFSFWSTQSLFHYGRTCSSVWICIYNLSCTFVSFRFFYSRFLAESCSFSFSPLPCSIWVWCFSDSTCTLPQFSIFFLSCFLLWFSIVGIYAGHLWLLLSSWACRCSLPPELPGMTLIPSYLLPLFFHISCLYPFLPGLWISLFFASRVVAKIPFLLLYYHSLPLVWGFLPLLFSIFLLFFLLFTLFLS